MSSNIFAGDVKSGCERFTQIPTAFLSLIGIEKIPHGVAVTWMLLKRYAYQTPSITISYSRLAEYRGINRRTTMRHIKLLTERGLLSPGGRERNRNQYEIGSPWIWVPALPKPWLWGGFLKLPNSMFEAIKRRCLSDTELLIWCVIRQLQSSGAACSASHGYIAKTIGLSHRQVVQRRIDNLVSRGWINSETRHRKTCLLRAVVHRIKSGAESRKLSVVGGTQLVTSELHPIVTSGLSGGDIRVAGVVTSELHHLESPIQTSNQNVVDEERPDTERGTYAKPGATDQRGGNSQETTSSTDKRSDPVYRNCVAEMNSLDLTAFQSQYPDLRINVQHDMWRDYWLGTNREGNPRWVDWKTGRGNDTFDGWCRNARRRKQSEPQMRYDLPEMKMSKDDWQWLRDLERRRDAPNFDDEG